MRGAISPLLNTPSWRGTQLKPRDFYLRSLSTYFPSFFSSLDEESFILSMRISHGTKLMALLYLYIKIDISVMLRQILFPGIKTGVSKSS
jgi:hypothetical protein